MTNRKGVSMRALIVSFLFLLVSTTALATSVPVVRCGTEREIAVGRAIISWEIRQEYDASFTGRILVVTDDRVYELTLPKMSLWKRGGGVVSYTARQIFENGQQVANSEAVIGVFGPPYSLNNGIIMSLILGGVDLLGNPVSSGACIVGGSG